MEEEEWAGLYCRPFSRFFFFVLSPSFYYIFILALFGRSGGRRNMGARGRIKLNGSLPNGSQGALPWKKERKKEKKNFWKKNSKKGERIGDGEMSKKEQKFQFFFFWFKRVLDQGPEHRESKMTVLWLPIIIILIS
jgi:hypothetical protein